MEIEQKQNRNRTEIYQEDIRIRNRIEIKQNCNGNRMEINGNRTGIKHGH